MMLYYPLSDNLIPEFQELAINKSNSTGNIFLHIMNEHYVRNFGKHHEAYRYNEEMRLYSAYIRLLSGKILYSTLKANAKFSIPSNSAVRRYIADYRVDATEGELRSKQLAEFIDKQNISTFVHLSEDATKISGRVQYDSRSNKIIGCVLRIDSQTGMPVMQGNEAISARSIENCFYDVHSKQQKPQSSYVNVIMAQSLTQASPPFCLMLFGTDGTFTKEVVFNRWKYITDELKKYNITVVSISSDSDPRYNSVMRTAINLGITNNDYPIWFNIRSDVNYIPVQDTVHIGTKLRNRLLNKNLKFGVHVVTADHLMALVQTVSKIEHNLTEKIVKTSDRMNFDSVLAICEDKVVSLVETKIENSEGTVFYLRIISNVLKSFLDPRLSAVERIRYIWVSTFLLRIWRKFIQENKFQNLDDHFITLNSYICVEINAHALVELIIYYKDRNMDELFSTVNVGSQPCESIFRQFRSFSPTYSTVVNCSLLEMIQRIAKIELQNDITHNKLKHFVFPNIGVATSTFYPSIDRNGKQTPETSLPDRSEIYEEIEMAKLEALEYAESLGVVVDTDLVCDVKLCQLKDVHKDIILTENVLNEIEDQDALQLFGNVSFREYSAKNINSGNITPSSLYVKIVSNAGEEYFVNKHTLCWFLGTTTNKLSSDRLRRVMDKL